MPRHLVGMKNIFQQEWIIDPSCQNFKLSSILLAEAWRINDTRDEVNLIDVHDDSYNGVLSYLSHNLNIINKSFKSHVPGTL